MKSAPLTALPLALALLPACKPHAPGPQGQPLPVQLLAAAGPDLNPCRNDTPCAVTLRIYELKSGADLDDLDYDALHDRGAEVFGQNLVKPPIERPLYPGDHRTWPLELDPTTTHVVTVALFGEALGDAWYNIYAVPREHPQRVCEARERGKTLADPCLFLALDGYEINGGRFPPAGFDIRVFEAECAPVVDTQPKKKKRKRRRRDRSPPNLPPADIPSTSAPPASPAPATGMPAAGPLP